MHLPIFVTIVSSVAVGVLGEVYNVPSISREELIGAAGKSNKLSNALFQDGLVSITDVQGFSGLRYNMLQELNHCAHLVPGGRDTMPRFEMHDHGETLRYSSAATITKGKLDYMDEPRACPGFLTAAKHFRKIVDEVVHEFVEAVEEIAVQPKGEDRTFSQLTTTGNQLEHFHFFDKTNEVSSKKTTANNIRSGEHLGSGGAVLDVHTDHGFFVVFIPASYWMVVAEEDASKALRAEEALDITDENGFLIEVEGKGTVQPVFTSRDSIVFMAGDAMKAFDSRFHVPRHTVNTVLTDATRSWYGRMLVPPEDYKMLPKGEADGGVTTTNLGCTSGRRVLDSLAGCDVGTSYCWHRCQESPPCAESEELVCVNTGTGDSWDPDAHCGCFVQCRNVTGRDSSGVASDRLDGHNAVYAGLALSVATLLLFR